MLKHRRKGQRSSGSPGGQLFVGAQRPGSTGGRSKFKVKGHVPRSNVKWPLLMQCASSPGPSFM